MNSLASIARAAPLIPGRLPCAEKSSSSRGPLREWADRGGTPGEA